MRIYKVETDAKPPNSRAKDYPSLSIASAEQREWLGLDEFKGRPFSREWKPLQLYIDHPLLPHPDFYDCVTGVFVCSQKAFDLTAEALEMAGELLPVNVEDEKGRFYLYNVTNCVNVVDPDKSVWEPRPNRRTLKLPAFHADRLGESTLFKIPDDFGINIYCLERSGDPDEGEFKALVEHHKLQGLRFELIWSEETFESKRQ